MRLHVWVNVLIHSPSRWLSFDLTFAKESSVSAIYYTTVFFKTIIFLKIITYLHLISSTTMFQYCSMEKIKWWRFFTYAQKICYKSRLVHFNQLEDFAHALKHLYTDLLFTPSTYLCKDCYNCALELVRSTDNEFTTDNKVTDNVVDKDEDFLPSILIRNIRKNFIRKKLIENYVKKKKN